MPKDKKIVYTVTGIYEDNKQPFGTYVEATTPIQAALAAYKMTESPSDLMILSVSEGRFPDLLTNEEWLSREEVIEMAKKEREAA